MNPEEASAFLAQWCFTIKSPAALQFIYGMEYVAEIQCCYPLDTGGSVYLILPVASHEEVVEGLCAENGLMRISQERSYSFLADFRQRHKAVWDRLRELL